jgi:hypothetical protein
LQGHSYRRLRHLSRAPSRPCGFPSQVRQQGGKRGGRGRPCADLADLKRDVRKVVEGVLSGEVPQGPGAVALQGYNTLLRAAKVELDVREQQELIERLEELEAVLERLAEEDNISIP